MDTKVDKSGVNLTIHPDGSIGLGLDDWLTISFSGKVLSLTRKK